MRLRAFNCFDKRTAKRIENKVEHKNGYRQTLGRHTRCPLQVGARCWAKNRRRNPRKGCSRRGKAISQRKSDAATVRKKRKVHGRFRSDGGNILEEKEEIYITAIEGALCTDEGEREKKGRVWHSGDNLPGLVAEKVAGWVGWLCGWLGGWLVKKSGHWRRAEAVCLPVNPVDASSKRSITSREMHKRKRC